MEEIKNAAKSWLYKAGYYHVARFCSGLAHASAKLVILVYHNIYSGKEFRDTAPHPFQLRPDVTSDVFGLHLHILSESYEVLSLDEGIRRLKDPRGRNDRMVAITFDDGYESFHRYAYPLLRKYDFPATVFLPTDFIGQNRIFWWDRLTQILFNVDISEFTLSQLESVAGVGLPWNFGQREDNLRQKTVLLKSFEDWMVNLPDETRDEKLDRLSDLVPDGNVVETMAEKTLSWEQVDEMSRHNISFGAHTCSHLNLKYASRERIDEEIRKSRLEIESRLNTKVMSFAYPYGLDIESYKRVRPVLETQGFQCARTSRWGFNDRFSDQLLLNRGHIGLYTQETLVRRDLMLNFLRKAV